MMNRFIDYVVDAVRRPREELSRRQHQVRFAWDLAVHCSRQLNRHRAEGMAAELTYRTIFALIPVAVLGLVMFRIVGGLEEVQSQVETQLYSFFGVPEIPPDYLAPSIVDHDSNQSGEVNDEARLQSQASIRATLREVTAKVAALDFASIGFVGLLLFIYAAIALAESVESLFNRIYDVSTKRPIHIRIAIHWSIITLGSGLLAMSLYMSGQVVDYFGKLGGGTSLTPLLNHVLSVGASWVLLFLLYALMPNTSVSLRAAVIGSLVGALLWETAKLGFQLYVVTAVPYSAIYGSLGLIPLFLFWIYLTWLIVLFGLTLTYTLQTLGGRRPPKLQWNEAELIHGDPDWMLPIMTEVASAFAEGRTIDHQGLADELGIPNRIVHEMTGKLIAASFLLRTTVGAGEEEALTLAKPADRISVAAILALAHQSRPTNTHPAWKTLAQLKHAQRQAAADQTLADVVSQTE